MRGAAFLLVASGFVAIPAFSADEPLCEGKDGKFRRCGARVLSDAEAAEFDRYGRSVQQRIVHGIHKAHGMPPGSQAVVDLTFVAGGRVSAVAISRSSGDPAVDESLLAAVIASAPFPRPRKSPGGEPVTVKIPFSGPAKPAR